MSQHRYIALLRGINVGGNNIIKMADLKKSFEDLKFTEVQTYIQSGNVLFSSESTNKTELEQTLEEGLSEAFQYKSLVVVVSAKELAQVISQSPKGFGKSPDDYRYDVLFVKKPATPEELLPQLSTKEGVDVVHAGDHALYFQRLVSKASQSHLNKLVQKPAYKIITIRNWNTTSKLHALASS